MAHKKYFFLAVFLAESLIFFGGVPEFILKANAEPLSFFVDSKYEFSGRSVVTASLKVTSNYGYFFIDDDWWNKLSASNQTRALNNLNNLAQEFDNIIYPKLTSFFGNIWSPGVDNDPRITILFLPLKGGAGGYTDYSDEYSKNVFARSNEREMFYLNAEYLNSPLEKSFLSHELQHLITFYQKDKRRELSEDIWLNESRSEYASTYLGYDDIFVGSNLEKRVEDFVKNLPDPLCEFKNESADYAAVNLFSHYLADRFGKEILSEMVRDEKVGIESISNALKNLGYNVNFSEVFTNWTIANLLNNCSLDKNFCYSNPNLNSDNLRISLGIKLEVPGVTAEVPIKDWQPFYYKLEILDVPDKKILKIDFEKENPQDLFALPLIVKNADGTISVNFMDVSGDKATAYVPDLGKVDSVIIIPSKQSKFSDFSDSDPVSYFKLSAGLVDKVPAVSYSNGSLLRARGDYRVYLIENGEKHWIPNPRVFNLYNLKWEDIKEVDDIELNKFPRAKLFRPRGDYRVYYLTESGLIRHIPSADVFLSYGNKWEDVIEIDSEELKVYPTANLIYLDGDYKIYKLENGKKRWIKTVQAFNRLGYDWSKIAPVNLTEFDAYQEGIPIY